MQDKRLKVIVLTQDPANNISFYRATGPLSKITGIKYELYTDTEGFKRLESGEINVILITCPYTMRHLHIIDCCKKFGIKVWIDFDDYITEIPVWNERGFLEYSNHPVQHVVQNSIKSADLITVSTEYLKNKWSKYSENIFVVPNAFDHEFLCNPSEAGTKNEVLYRGGQSHNLDLWAYRAPIINAMKNSNWTPHFVGMNPIYINQELDGSWTPQLSKKDYWKFLEKNQAKILIVPLADVPLNYGKSNIAFLEGTYAGCAVLAPDWPEWQKPGIINYSNGVEFEKKLKGMMSGRIDLKERVQKAREYIMSNQTLEKVNRIRIELIEKYLK